MSCCSSLTRGSLALCSLFARHHQSNEKPDLEEAERLLKQSAARDPDAFFTNIELGNVCLRRGSREDALRAYTAALQHGPNDSALRQAIQEQIKRVSMEALDQIPELRDPNLE